MAERSLAQRVADLERRTSRLIQVGVVAEIDPAAQRVRVDIGERTSAWLRWTVQRAGSDRTWWPPTEGEQVLVFAPNGDVVAAVAGNSLYQQEHDAPADAGTIRRTVMGDGARFTYDRDAKRLEVELPGDAVAQIAGDATVEIGANASVAIAGDASVDVGGAAALTAGTEATVDAPKIALNKGTGCITQQSICHFTGQPHGDGSKTVKAGK